MDKIRLNTIEDAIDDFREGKFVIVVDDEDRENEGDLICAAEKITPDMVNFMLKYARGVLCAPMLPTVLPPSRHWPTLHRRHRPSDVQATSTPSMPRTMVCCAAVDIQRLPSICANWLDCTLPER